MVLRSTKLEREELDFQIDRVRKVIAILQDLERPVTGNEYQRLARSGAEYAMKIADGKALRRGRAQDRS